MDQKKEVVYHKLGIEELFKSLQTSPTGLSSEDVRIRQEKYGLNLLSEKKKTPLFIRFFLQFKNFFSLLLLAGSLLSFLSEYLSPGQGSIYIAYTLLFVTVINSVFTFIQEYRAEKAMESFKNLMKTRILTIRDGVEKEIDASQLVPGDVIILREGDKVPADGRLIEENVLKVDHSTLTGESEPQLRSLEATSENSLNSRNMVLSGTLVQSGYGKAIVVGIGDNTEIGKIAEITQNIKVGQTNIQRELNHFIKIISSIAITLGVIFFLLGLHLGNDIWTNMVFAIGIIVANVPEGLLPTVTLTLSIAAKKMAKKNALVKNIESIETIGAITVICTDKTGTLTENSMTVESIYINHDSYSYDKESKGLHLDGKGFSGRDVKGFDSILHSMILCNNAQIVRKNGEETFGDPTEVALLDVGTSFKDIYLQRQKYKRLKEIPFESSKKYMITLHSQAETDKAYMKGAPEVVVSKCSMIMSEGKPRKITKKDNDLILERNQNYSSQGNRVLAFAEKVVSKKDSASSKLDTSDYIFLGLVSMRDPPRKEVPLAVKQCHEAGIRIIVISGDQLITVESIARSVGIVSGSEGKDFKALTGDEVREMPDDKLKEVLKQGNIIVARAYPQDKLRVVTMLSQMGEIVAVTGDGVNDAPALKKAHVGVAMGKNGTEVAKEASDIVLLDDNFATIVSAVESGRTVYSNIKGFIMYILTSNMPEILPFIFFVAFGWPLALPVLLILAIDLGTDMVPAIALGMEKPESDVMKRPPRKTDSKLLTGNILFMSYGIIGMLQAFSAFVIFFMILFDGGWRLGQEISIRDPLYMSAIAGFFASVIISQIFDVLICRTRRISAFNKNFFSNKMIFIGIASEIFLLIMIVFVPFFQKIFGTAPFDLKYVPLMIILGSLVMVFDETRKFVARRRNSFSEDMMT